MIHRKKVEMANMIIDMVTFDEPPDVIMTAIYNFVRENDELNKCKDWAEGTIFEGEERREKYKK